MLPHCFLGIGDERTVFAFELELLALAGADCVDVIVLAHLRFDSCRDALMLLEDTEHLRDYMAGIGIHFFKLN
jgi:hypothetical protein